MRPTHDQSLTERVSMLNSNDHYSILLSCNHVIGCIIILDRTVVNQMINNISIKE